MPEECFLAKKMVSMWYDLDGGNILYDTYWNLQQYHMISPGMKYYVQYYVVYILPTTTTRNVDFAADASTAGQDAETDPRVERHWKRLESKTKGYQEFCSPSGSIFWQFLDLYSVELVVQAIQFSAFLQPFCSKQCTQISVTLDKSWQGIEDGEKQREREELFLF